MTSTNLSPKQLNFAHLAIACVDVIKKPLIDILDINIKPNDLCKQVKKSKYLMSRLNSDQLMTCGISLHTLPDYSKFDTTLLYALIRNLCTGLQEPAQGWGKPPQDTDTQIGDDIERIRLFRNKNLAHVYSGELNETQFESLWSNLEDIIKRIQSFTTANGCHSDYIQQLADLKGRTVEIDEYTTIINALKEEIKELEKKKITAIPWNVKVQYEDEVSTWKKDDSAYFETRNFPAMFRKVRNQSYITFVGTPGSGKSATAHHIALKLQDEDGYEILPIVDLKDIQDYCDPCNKQVFVIDDVIGEFGFDTNKLNRLEDFKKKITSPIMRSSKILMTCREVVFRNKAVSISFLNNEENVIQLQSEENKLTADDKRSLLAKYNLEEYLIPSERLFETSNMFPFLCKMYSNRMLKDFMFFITPIPFILDELKIMQQKNPIHYVSLVLLMFNENRLSKEDFKKEHGESNFIAIKTDVLASCEVESMTDSFKFTRALEDMEKTYIQACGLQFFFIHDSLFEIVAYHFGCQFPELILKYMSITYISNYIEFVTYGAAKYANESEEEDETSKDNGHNQKDDVVDLHLTLQESYLPKFAERLFKESGKGLLFEVCSALIDSSVRRAFIDAIKRKSYADLQTTFLLEHMVDKRMIWYLEELQFHFKQYKRYNNFNREINDVWPEMLFPKKSKKGTIRIRFISLVVFYGFHEILQHIIDEMLNCNENIDDLFHLPCKTGNEGNDVTKHENAEDEFTSVNVTNTMKGKHSRTDIDIVDSDSDSEDIDTLLEPDFVEQWRLLCFGCFSGDFNTVNTLLKHINKAVIDNLSDIRLKGPYNSGHLNPLRAALNDGFLNIARELIKAGAELSKSFLLDAGEFDLSTTLLFMKAVCSKYNEKNIHPFQLLPFFFEESGDDVDFNKRLKMLLSDNTFYGGEESEPKITPLMLACQKGYHDSVKALLKAGADVNLGLSSNTPCVLACKGCHLDIFEELLKAGANIDPNYINLSDLARALDKSLQVVELAKKLIQKGVAVDSNDRSGTLLTYACSKKNIIVVKMLLNEGADVNLESGNTTPLISALRRPTYSSFYPDYDKNVMGLLKLLIKNGADVNLVTGNSTPLKVACEEGNPDCVKELIKEGPDVNLEAGNETPLMVSCKNGNIDVIKELIKADVNINLKAGDKTPLAVACQLNQIHIVRELIKANADVNLQVGDKTPLTIVCQKGYTDVLEELIKAGLDFDIAIQDEITLIDSCEAKHTNVLGKLEEVGTEINFRLGHKSQCISCCPCRHLYIAELLYKAGGSVNLKDGNNALLTSNCLMKHLGKIEDLIKLGSTASPKGIQCAAIKTACYIGHLSLVKEFIKVGADFNFSDEDETPLILACQEGHVDVVKELIHAGANVNLVAGSKSPITVACKGLQVDIVKELINANANVNIVVEDKTPLTLACQINAKSDINRKELFDVIEQLTIAGADVNTKVGNKIPLMIACQTGHIDAVKLFVKYDADVNLANGGETPLTVACFEKHIDVVEELLKAKADVNQKDEHNSPLTAAMSNFSMKHLQLLKTLIKAGADVNMEYRKNTPLSLACKEGCIRLTDTLIKAGANVNRKVGKNSMLAVACKEGHIGVIKELIKAGADVNIGDDRKKPLKIAYDMKSMNIVEVLYKAGAMCNSEVGVISPITVACFIGNNDKVKRFIKDQVALDVIDNNDKTPLTAACQKGNLSLVKDLINAGASVDFKDRYNTPLTTACFWGYFDVVKELIKAGSDVNLIDVCNTPLTAACFWGEYEIVKELIESGADVNLQDKQNTPLTVACLKNHIHIVKELIKAKADVNQEARRNTPLTAACRKGYTCIVEVLIEAGADVNLGYKIQRDIKRSLLTAV